MTEAYITVNGVQASTASVSIPYYGLWTADVMLPGAAQLSPGDKVTLAVGNLTLAGSVFRAAAFAGQIKARLIAGAGGWSKTVQAQQYAFSTGLRLSMVLNDLAAAVGERVQLEADRTLPSWTREATRAGKILRLLSGPLWYIDESGVTQVKAARASVAISSPYQVTRWDTDRGEAEIATEDLASWRPGNTFANEVVLTAQTISSVSLRSDGAGSLRLTVLTVGPNTERTLEGFRELVRDELADYSFSRVYEYIVQSATDTTVDATAGSSSAGLPSLRALPILPGLPGAVAHPGNGSRLAVAFLNGDAGRPVVLGAFDSSPASRVALDTGHGTAEHVTTIEAVVNVLLTLIQAVNPLVVTSPAVADALIAAALSAAAAQTSTSWPLSKAALLSSLAAKQADLTSSGNFAPSVGCPNLQAG